MRITFSSALTTSATHRTPTAIRCIPILTSLLLLCFIILFSSPRLVTSLPTNDVLHNTIVPYHLMDGDLGRTTGLNAKPNGTTPNTSITSPLSSTTTTTISPLSAVQNYTLRNLEPYTEYLVTLRVFNPAGDGPTATLAASTDEGGR